MRVHDSALKHGIDPDDAIYAATWSLWIEDFDEHSPARLGFDTCGRHPGVVVLVLDSGTSWLFRR